VEYFFLHFFHTVSTGAYIVAVAAWLWLVVVVWRSWRSSDVSLGQVVRRVLLHPLSSLVVFLVVAYLLVPYKAIGWHKVNTRIVPFILGISLAAVAAIPTVHFQPRLRRIFAVSTALCTVVMSAFITPEVLRMDRLVDEYISGIDKFEPNSRLLAVHHENPAFGGIRPLTRAHEYYHLAKGGVNGKSIPYMNTLSVMWYRSYPVSRTFPEFDPQAPEAIKNAYDYILVFGDESEAIEESVRGMGFTDVHRQGRLKLFRQSTAESKPGNSSVAGSSVSTVRSMQ
jgi:hypothetical protein